MDDLLKLAVGEGSSLTRSFWFGKLLQLHEDKEIITKHGHPPASSSSHSKSDISALDNLDGDVKEKVKLMSITSSVDSELLGSRVAEALECLRHCETSLSQNVYDLVVSRSTHSIPPRMLLSISESSFLLKDCTLDWNVVSVHLDKGTQHKYRHCIDLIMSISLSSISLLGKSWGWWIRVIVCHKYQYIMAWWL